MTEGFALKNLSVVLSKRPILSNLTLDVAKGQFVVLLGPSGCGKTTLLRTIARELQALTGSVQSTVDVGYAQQSAPLFPWLSVLQNLVLGSDQPRQIAEEKARGLLQRLGLENMASHKPESLSGGMRSRVSLARAFMCEPKLVLMDEPFNGLDIQNRERLQAMTIELWRETGATVLLVSHDLDEAIRLSDRLLVLSKHGDRFVMDELNTIPRPRALRSIDMQPLPEFRLLWNQIQKAIV